MSSFDIFFFFAHFLEMMRISAKCMDLISANLSFVTQHYTFTFDRNKLKISENQVSNVRVIVEVEQKAAHKDFKK